MVELKQIMLLPSLVTLLVSNNRVQTLTNDIFVFLKSLKFLDFSANRLIKIENAAFSGLVNLQTLYLNNNNLDSPDSDSDYFFLYNLSLLEHLDLSFNYFYYLSHGYLNHLKSLTTLLLNNNRLKEISSRLFRV